MRCPYCGYRESKVVDSRPADEGASIRRRRECLSCEKRFTTYETVEYLPDRQIPFRFGLTDELVVCIVQQALKVHQMLQFLHCGPSFF